MPNSGLLQPEKPFINGHAEILLNGRKKTVGDFWQWAYSDLLQNITRGYVAQFIVAWSLGVDTEPNEPWRAYDVKTKDGKRVEVKSTSYLQSWTSERSEPKQPRPVFKLAPRKYYSNGESVLSESATWNADIYVLCYLHHNDIKSVNVLDLSQWTFWVLNRKDISLILKNKASISVAELERSGFKKVSAGELGEAIGCHHFS